MKRRTFLKTAAGLASGAVLAEAAGLSESAAQDGLVQDFSQKAKDLRQSGGVVVGILNDQTFAGREVPRSLGVSHFRETWGAQPGVKIVPLDKYEIRSFSIVFRSHIDMLVYPYGALYPMDAFPSYTGDTVAGFLKRGGAVLTTGGVPFGNPVNDEGKPPLEGSPDPLSLNPDIYSRWVAPLGFKYYVHPHRPPVMGVERSFLPAAPAQIPLPGSQLGLVVNNSSHAPVPRPYHGNAFPERYPARSVTPLFWGEDSYGRKLATNGVLVQDFESGSRSVHLSQGDSHPLTPGSGFFSPLMADILSLLLNRIFVKDVSTGYACYRDGESVTVHAEFVSFEPSDVEAEVALEIRHGDKIVDSHRETVRFAKNQIASKTWQWSPGKFEGDEYTIGVSLTRNRQTLSRANNGFVVWKDEIVRRAPGIVAEGQYLRKADGEAFVAGTNYYESTRGELMWYRPDVRRICADLAGMRGCGVNYIRPHYHHLKWFKDYLEFQHEELPPYFESLKDLASPMPDERTWRMFDVFIYLCQKHGIVYGGDLFTVVPEDMGDPRGWFPLIEAVVSADKRAAARGFFRALTERYKGIPCIAWDLWNEPEVPLPLLKQWTEDMRRIVVESGERRVITVGGGSGEALGASVDFLGLHLNARKIRELTNRFEKPAIAQEVYLDHAEDLTSELAQAEDMREGMLAAVRGGLAGFAPWSWTRQMRLWQDSYEHDPSNRMESWDDRLGSHTHDDGTLKPAGQVFRDLALFLRTISFKSCDRSTHSIFTDRGQVSVALPGIDGAASYSLFHFRGSDCFGAMSLGSIEWQGKTLLRGPESGYLYAFSEDGEIATTKRLVFKSEQPGVLRLYGRTPPSAITLTEVCPGGPRKLAGLPSAVQGDAVEISIQPTQEAYWVTAEW